MRIYWMLAIVLYPAVACAGTFYVMHWYNDDSQPLAFFLNSLWVFALPYLGVVLVYAVIAHRFIVKRATWMEFHVALALFLGIVYGLNRYGPFFYTAPIWYFNLLPFVLCGLPVTAAVFLPVALVRYLANRNRPTSDFDLV